MHAAANSRKVMLWLSSGAVSEPVCAWVAEGWPQRIAWACQPKLTGNGHEPNKGGIVRNSFSGQTSPISQGIKPLKLAIKFRYETKLHPQNSYYSCVVREMFKLHMVSVNILPKASLSSGSPTIWLTESRVGPKTWIIFVGPKTLLPWQNNQNNQQNITQFWADNHFWYKFAIVKKSSRFWKYQILVAEIRTMLRKFPLKIEGALAAPNRGNCRLKILSSPYEKTIKALKLAVWWEHWDQLVCWLYVNHASKIVRVACGCIRFMVSNWNSSASIKKMGKFWYGRLQSVIGVGIKQPFSGTASIACVRTGLNACWLSWPEAYSWMNSQSGNSYTLRPKALEQFEHLAGSNC